MILAVNIMDKTPEPNTPPAASTVAVELAPPIQSRFLFVDVAALRAKQLRRGASVRFEAPLGVPALFKAERLAMEEVRRGLVQYEVLPAAATRPEEHP